MSEIKTSADTLFRNGRIYTVDRDRPWARCAAVKAGRFVAVGEEGNVKWFVGSDTRVVDLGGRTAMPGINAGAQRQLRRVCRPGVGDDLQHRADRHHSSSRAVVALPHGRWSAGRAAAGRMFEESAIYRAGLAFGQIGDWKKM